VLAQRLAARICEGCKEAYSPTPEVLQKYFYDEVPDDFVVATGIRHTVKDFLQGVCDAVGVNWQDCVTVRPDVLKKKPVTLIGDSAKLRKATGWEPKVSFEEMIRILVAKAESEPHQ